eukprot:2767695-Pleurochrysis_carterae.AAC.7
MDRQWRRRSRSPAVASALILLANSSAFNFARVSRPSGHASHFEQSVRQVDEPVLLVVLARLSPACSSEAAVEMQAGATKSGARNFS